jgi:hypothetical protein
MFAATSWITLPTVTEIITHGDAHRGAHFGDASLRRPPPMRWGNVRKRIANYAHLYVHFFCLGVSLKIWSLGKHGVGYGVGYGVAGMTAQDRWQF